MKQIIIVQTEPRDGGEMVIRTINWFAIADPARRVPLSGSGSRWPLATQAEVDAIGDGSVVEELKDHSLPSNYTLAQVKVTLEKWYGARAAYIAAQPNRIEHKGKFYDGTVWSA